MVWLAMLTSHLAQRLREGVYLNVQIVRERMWKKLLQETVTTQNWLINEKVFKKGMLLM